MSFCLYLHGFEQHQDKVTSENLGVPTDHNLLDNSSFNNVSHVYLIFI